MDESRVEQVSRFFSGTMSEAERAAFHAQRRTDPELQAEYDFQLSLLLAVQADQVRQAYDQDFPEAEVRPLWTARNRWLVAAAAVVLLLIAGWWLTPRPSPLPEQLAIAQALADPTLHLPSNAKGEAALDSSRLDTLAQWLRQERYAEVVNRMGTSPAELPSGTLDRRASELLLGLGIAYLRAPAPAQDLRRAEQLLDRVAQQGADPSFRNHARRQRVLLALYQEQPQLARARLDSLAQGYVDPQPWVQSAAQEALEKW